MTEVQKEAVAAEEHAVVEVGRVSALKEHYIKEEPPMTQEMMAELRTYIRQEVERAAQERREGQNAWRRATKALEDRMRRFDYVETWDATNAVGKQIHMETERLCAWKIREAFSAPLRCVYQVTGAANIPAEKEGEMVAFMDGVLTLMEQMQNGERFFEEKDNVSV